MEWERGTWKKALPFLGLGAAGFVLCWSPANVTPMQDASLQGQTQPVSERILHTLGDLGAGLVDLWPLSNGPMERSGISAVLVGLALVGQMYAVLPMILSVFWPPLRGFLLWGMAGYGMKTYEKRSPLLLLFLGYLVMLPFSGNNPVQVLAGGVGLAWGVGDWLKKQSWPMHLFLLLPVLQTLVHAQKLPQDPIHLSAKKDEESLKGLAALARARGLAALAFGMKFVVAEFWVMTLAFSACQKSPRRPTVRSSGMKPNL